MDLEHPYFYTANSRLSLFADDANRTIVFEKSGYANRASDRARTRLFRRRPA